MLLGVVETVAIIRDFLLIFVFLSVLIVTLLSYRKVSTILDSAKRTMISVEEVAETVSSRIVGPAASGSGAAFGLGKVAAFFLGLSRRKKDKGKGGDSDG